MNVLVDSSLWIDYFRGTGQTDPLDFLIEEDRIVTNDLILAELLPPLYLQKNRSLIALLREIKRRPMDIRWDEIIRLQISCLRHGINGVGIPDLLVAQNAIQGDLLLMSRDKHFSLIARHTSLNMYE